MAQTHGGLPAAGFAQLGEDAEQVAMIYPRPLPVPPQAWRAAKLSIPSNVRVLTDGVGYPA